MKLMKLMMMVGVKRVLGLKTGVAKKKATGEVKKGITQSASKH
jgi:hypothetical protein